MIWGWRWERLVEGGWAGWSGWNGSGRSHKGWVGVIGVGHVEGPGVVKEGLSGQGVIGVVSLCAPSEMCPQTNSNYNLSFVIR